MKTLGLNSSWDLTVDDLGNLLIKDGNNRLAQDVASSVRVWLGELPFDIERGIDYSKPDENRSILDYKIKSQAVLVDGVKECIVDLTALKDRVGETTIYVTNEQDERIEV